jgi:hypothetical protein
MSIPLGRSMGVFRALRSMLGGGRTTAQRNTSTEMQAATKAGELVARKPQPAKEPTKQTSLVDFLGRPETQATLRAILQRETREEMVERRQRNEHVVEFPAERVPGSVQHVLEEAQRTGQKPSTTPLHDERPPKAVDLRDMPEFIKQFDSGALPEQWYDTFGDNRAAALRHYIETRYRESEPRPVNEAPLTPIEGEVREHDQKVHSLWMNLQDRWNRQHDIYMATFGEQGSPLPSQEEQNRQFMILYSQYLNTQYDIPTLMSAQKLLESGKRIAPRLGPSDEAAARQGINDPMSPNPWPEKMFRLQKHKTMEEYYKDVYETVYKPLKPEHEEYVTLDELIDQDPDNVKGRYGVKPPGERYIGGLRKIEGSLDETEAEASEILSAAEESPAPSRVSPEVDDAFEELKSTRWRDLPSGRKQLTVDPDWINNINTAIFSDSRNINPKGHYTKRGYYVEKALALFKEQNMLVELMNRLSGAWEKAKLDGNRVPGQQERNRILESNIKQMIEAMSDLLDEADPDKVQEYFDNRPPDEPDMFPDTTAGPKPYPSFAHPTIPVAVHRSNAGYYIGQVDEDGPYSRLSVEYYPDRESAQKALDDDTWTRRDHP